MVENTCFLSLSIDPKLHNTCNKGNIYKKIYTMFNTMHKFMQFIK